MRRARIAIRNHQKVVARENAAFDEVYRALEAAFQAHKPDAMARTLELLRQTHAAKAAREKEGRQHDLDWVEEVLAPKIERLSVLYRENLKTSLYVTDLIGPTPEMLARRRNLDVIVRLHADRHLDDAQVWAAGRLATLVQSVCGELGARAQNLNRTGRRSELPDRHGFEFHDVYRPWAEMQRANQAFGARHLDCVLEVAVWRQPIKDTRTRWRMSFERCVQYVADGLSDYAIALKAYESNGQLLETTGVDQ